MHACEGIVSSFHMQHHTREVRMDVNLNVNIITWKQVVSTLTLITWKQVVRMDVNLNVNYMEASSFPHRRKTHVRCGTVTPTHGTPACLQWYTVYPFAPMMVQRGMLKQSMAGCAL